MKPDEFLITKAHTKMLVQAVITLDVVDSYEEAGRLLEQYRANPPSVELSAAPDAAKCNGCSYVPEDKTICEFCDYPDKPPRG